jgi:hypothetical protein
VKQAEIGSAKTMIDKVIETNCNPLCNTSILLRPASFMRHSRFSLLRIACPFTEKAAFSEVPDPDV